MTPNDRRRLLAQPFPRIDALVCHPAKSWAGCYIRDPADQHSMRRVVEEIDFAATLSAADEQDYQAYLDGVFAPRRRRFGGKQ